MRTELFIATCAALNYVAKLLDDYYVSDQSKMNVAGRLNRLYERIYQTSFPDIANALAEWFFQPNETQATEFYFAVGILYYVFGVYFFFHTATRPAWYAIVIVIILEIPISALGVLAIYVPARRLYLYLRRNKWQSIRQWAGLLAIGLPVIVLFISKPLSDFDERMIFGSYLPGMIISFLYVVMFFSLFPFACLGIYIVVAFVIKIIILSVRFVVTHFLKKAADRNKPFGYTAAVVTVILAFIKIYDEYTKSI